jgi:hypothetical protein
MEYEGYIIESDKTYGMYSIRPIGSGTVVKELRSKYLTIRDAISAIDRTKDLVDKKRKRNGQRNSAD